MRPCTPTASGNVVYMHAIRRVRNLRPTAPPAGRHRVPLLWPAMRTTITTLALLLTLAACSSTSSPPASTLPAAPATALGTPKADAGGLTTTTQAVDPYEVFQAAAKAQGIEVPPGLDRDGALARALLGCGTTFPPKTLDAELAKAYALQITQARAQGHCA